MQWYFGIRRREEAPKTIDARPNFLFEARRPSETPTLRLLLQFLRWIHFLFLTFLTFGVAGLTAQAQTQYTADGTPTGIEEEIRWRANRARFDTASENATRGTAYTDVPASAGPFAPNQRIAQAARHQSEDMAKANVFQHATVPGSLFYNATTQPDPWDRMEAEGYIWNYAGENIAAGYTTAEAAYVGWWNSTGHRVNMCEAALREIGNGYYFWSASTYRHYYTMDLGTSGNTCFFTDTAFRDANGNNTFEQTEGLSGVAIRLRVGNTDHSSYDISSSVGSFAIPIQSIGSGAVVQVILSNTTSASITVHVPRDYRSYNTLVLGAGEARSYGTFTRPSSARNVGFRDVTPGQVPLVAPRLNISVTGSTTVLSWPSMAGLEYQAQWTTNLTTWNPVTNAFRFGTGSTLTQIDSSVSPTRKFYRVVTRRP
jgi:uncharacterized protein YkwD